MCMILISKALRLTRVNEGSHSFTCNLHVYPCMEWAILSVFPSCRASPYFGEYSFPSPLRVGDWVGLERLVKQKLCVCGFCVFSALLRARAGLPKSEHLVFFESQPLHFGIFRNAVGDAERKDTWSQCLWIVDFLCKFSWHIHQSHDQFANEVG